MEAGRKVGGEEGPNGKGAKERRTVGKSTGTRSGRQSYVNGVRKQEGPEEGNGAE